MAYLINLTAEPNQEVETLLDGQNCIITLYQRGGKMFLDLTADDTPVVRGAIIHNDTDILPYYTESFRGNLRFLDRENDSDPLWEGVGKRFFLYYLTEQDLQELTDED